MGTCYRRRLRRFIRLYKVLNHLVEHAYQFPDFLYRCLGVWAEESVVADLHEPIGQDVLEESADKLHGIERHAFPAFSMDFPVTKSHMMVVGADDA